MNGNVFCRVDQCNDSFDLVIATVDVRRIWKQVLRSLHASERKGCWKTNDNIYARFVDYVSEIRLIHGAKPFKTNAKIAFPSILVIQHRIRP